MQDSNNKNHRPQHFRPSRQRPSGIRHCVSRWHAGARSGSRRRRGAAGSPGWKRSLRAKLGKTVKKTAERCAIANVVGMTILLSHSLKQYTVLLCCAEPLEANTLGAVFKLEGSRRAPGVRNFCRAPSVRYLFVGHSFAHPPCATFRWTTVKRNKRVGNQQTIMYLFRIIKELECRIFSGTECPRTPNDFLILTLAKVFL